MNKDVVNLINDYINETEANRSLITWVIDHLILNFTESMKEAINFENKLLDLFTQYKLVCKIKLVNRDQIKPKFVVDEVKYHSLQFFIDFILLCLRYYRYEDWFENVGKTLESGFRENSVNSTVLSFNRLARKLKLKIRIVYWHANRYEIAFVL